MYTILKLFKIDSSKILLNADCFDGRKSFTMQGIYIYNGLYNFFCFYSQWIHLLLLFEIILFAYYFILCSLIQDVDKKVQGIMKTYTQKEQTKKFISEKFTSCTFWRQFLFSSSYKSWSWQKYLENFTMTCYKKLPKTTRLKTV